MENNSLANLKASLEENRAHLKKNLIKKESECSRLNVQLKVKRLNCFYLFKKI